MNYPSTHLIIIHFALTACGDDDSNSALGVSGHWNFDESLEIVAPFAYRAKAAP